MMSVLGFRRKMEPCFFSPRRLPDEAVSLPDLFEARLVEAFEYDCDDGKTECGQEGILSFNRRLLNGVLD